MTPRAGLVLEHFMNKLGRGPQGDANISNIKSLCHPVSEKKNFEDGLLCSYVQLVTPAAGPVLTQGASYEHTW